MSDIFEQFESIGIIPVVVLDDEKDAKGLAGALVKGNLPCAEVTFRTKACEEAIRIMSEEYPDMLVGAGTVLSPEQVERAIKAGAKFIVSPGLNPKVVEYCMARQIPIIPGTQTPSDMEKAIELGLKVVKFFPAEAVGGIKAIKAMSAPYGNVRFLPTGGINLKNLKEYLSAPVIAACGGSYMVTADLIDNNKWDEITDLCKKSREIVEEARA